MLMTSKTQSHAEIPQGTVSAGKWMLNYGAVTDVGEKRAGNEDFYLLYPDRQLFVLADGMGGHAAGEVAARLAAETVAAYFEEKDLPGPVPQDEEDQDLLSGHLLRALQIANTSVFEEARHSEARQGMGTTLVVLTMHGDYAYWTHVGDSRIYVLREGSLGLITRDHSLLEEAILAQGLSHKEANEFRRAFPYRNILTQAVGTRREVEIEVHRMKVQPGDLFVMTSDGIHDLIGPSEIIRVLKRERQNLGCAARELVDRANAAGGPDNSTALLVGFDLAI